MALLADNTKQGLLTYYTNYWVVPRVSVTVPTSVYALNKLRFNDTPFDINSIAVGTDIVTSYDNNLIPATRELKTRVDATDTQVIKEIKAHIQQEA